MALIGRDGGASGGHSWNAFRCILIFLALLVAGAPVQAEGYARNKDVLLKPRHEPNKCLDMDARGFLVIWECHSRPNQLFTFLEMAGTEIRVKDLCVALNGNAGDPIAIAPCAANQAYVRWDHTRSGSFRKSGTNLCIDVAGAGIQNGTRVIAYQCTQSPNQQFRVVRTTPYKEPPPPPPPPPAGATQNVELRPQHTSNMCLDFEANTRLVINRCSGARTQKFTYGPGNSFWIRDGIEGCLAILSGSTIGSAYCHSSTRNIRWEVSKDGVFRNLGARLCMDVMGGRTVPGSPVVGYSCHRGKNQQFKPPIKFIIVKPDNIPKSPSSGDASPEPPPPSDPPRRGPGPFDPGPLPPLREEQSQNDPPPGEPSGNGQKSPGDIIGDAIGDIIGNIIEDVSK